MDDFIVEPRPRRFQNIPEYPTGYVAELRPSSRRPALPSEFPRKWTLNSDTTHVKPFEHSSQAMSGNYESDVDKLIQGKGLSIDKITSVLHTSVVTLINTLLKGHSVGRIEGSIKVTLDNSQDTLMVNLNENYSSFKSDEESLNSWSALGDGIKVKDAFGRGNTEQSCESMLSCQSDLNFGFESRPEFRNLNAAILEAPFAGVCEEQSKYLPKLITGSESEKYGINQIDRRISDDSDKSENDEESGYSSSERGSICSPPRKSSIESIGSLLDTRVDDGPGELVIDECQDMLRIEEATARQSSPMEMIMTPKNAPHVSPRVDTGSAIEYDEYIDFDQKNGCAEPVLPVDDTTPLVHVAVECVGGQRESNVNDAPMDLSGDCKVNGNVSTASEEGKRSTLLSCKKCSATLLNTDEFGKHTLECHKLHACLTCQKLFSSKNNLKRHVRIHTGSRPYKCGQCEMSFARKDDLKGHTLTHDFTKPFRCSLCKKGYTDRACVKNHMSKEHCSRLMRICPQCGESFDREETFLEHKKSHPSLKQFSCDTCPFIGTNHLMALKHKLLHSHKLFSCKPCNAYFSDPFDYTKHVRKHKKNKEYTFYVCCFCNCTLPTYDQFVRHEYSHAQGKFHECVVCKKQFKSKVLMLEHTLVHSTSIMSTDDISSPTKKDKSTENVSTDTSMDCMEEKIFDTPKPRATAMKEITQSNDPEICHIITDNNPCVPTSFQNNQVKSMFDGELLDLSLKPSRSFNHSTSENQSLVADQIEQKTVADISSPKTPSMSPCVPRNGYTVIDAHVSGQETSRRGICFDDGQTTSKSNDEEFQIVWQSPSIPLVEDSQAHAMKIEKKSHLMQRNTSPKIQIDGKTTQHANDVRYTPYAKRDTMVTLVSKYVAARKDIPHEHLLKDIANTPSGLRLNFPSLPKSGLQMDNHSLVSPRFEVSENSYEERPAHNVMIGLTGKQCLSPNTKPCLSVKQEMAEELQDCYRRLSPVSTTLAETANRSNAAFQNHHQLTPDTFAQRTTSVSPIDTPATHASSNITTVGNTPDSNNVSRECGVCNTSFESFSQLESHSVTEHNRYLCEFCGKGFTARPNRDRHVRYHTGERPYKCELCPSAFFRGDDLKYHRTTRHPMEQISCSRCAASFTWQKDLERHLRHSKCVATS